MVRRYGRAGSEHRQEGSNFLVDDYCNRHLAHDILALRGCTGLREGEARLTAEQDIESWFKDEYRKLQEVHGKYGVPADKSQELSDEYKRRHNVLIDERKQQQKKEILEANNDRTCEVCLDKLPVRRGRPSKRCENCK